MSPPRWSSPWDRTIRRKRLTPGARGPTCITSSNNVPERIPTPPAVTFKNETLTYDALWTKVKDLAAGLARARYNARTAGRGVARQADRDGGAIFGISAAGAAFVPVNPLLRPAQVGYILRDCDVRLLVTTSERLARLRNELASCPTVEDVVLVGARIDERVPPAPYRVHRWERPAVRITRLAAPAIDLDMAAILYTSGSTGMPKGVVLSHRNLIVGAESVSHYLGTPPTT